MVSLGGLKNVSYLLLSTPMRSISVTIRASNQAGRPSRPSSSGKHTRLSIASESAGHPSSLQPGRGGNFPGCSKKYPKALAASLDEELGPSKLSGLNFVAWS